MAIPGIAGDYKASGKLYPILNEFVRDFNREFRDIPEERRYRLNEVIAYIKEQQSASKLAQLLFIDTDQSTLSQMTNVWAITAAHYFGLRNLKVYSGGLNPSEFNQEAIFAMERAGFIIYRSTTEGGEIYKIKYSYNLEPIFAFAKKIDYRKNPRSDFMAIVIEPNADLNLPRVRGTYQRLTLLYEDPAGYSGTELEEEKFDEICRQIGLEMFYIFSQLRKA
jgi:arsenate reductase